MGLAQSISCCLNLLVRCLLNGLGLVGCMMLRPGLGCLLLGDLVVALASQCGRSSTLRSGLQGGARGHLRSTCSSNLSLRGQLLRSFLGSRSSSLRLGLRLGSLIDCKLGRCLCSLAARVFGHLLSMLCLSKGNSLRSFALCSLGRSLSLLSFLQCLGRTLL